MAQQHEVTYQTESPAEQPTFIKTETVLNRQTEDEWNIKEEA